MNLRDHSQDCEHGNTREHYVDHPGTAGAQLNELAGVLMVGKSPRLRFGSSPIKYGSKIKPNLSTRH